MGEDCRSYRSAGDIAIWTGGDYAQYGHVAIVLSSNGSSFEVIDQNGDGKQAPGKIRKKEYERGYWGVIRPFPLISYMETPASGGNYSGSIRILGYALHKNGIRNVTAWINGQSMNCPMYNSPDVAQVYPGYPTGNEGFQAQIPSSCLKEGENEIEIYAYEHNDTPHLIAKHKFNWNSFVSKLESPVENGSYNGTLSIQGYALHKNGIRNVTAWVNNQSMDCPMYERSEIAAQYPGYPTGNEGFKVEIPISCLKNGENEIRV